jgi:hypothetical protein
MLRHGDPAVIVEKKHIFLLIADYILLILEDESDFFDRCFDKAKFYPGPNGTLNKLTK